MSKIKFMVVIAAVLSVVMVFAIAQEMEEKIEPDKTGHDHAVDVMPEGLREMIKGAEAGAVSDPNSPEAKIAEAWKEFESASNSEARQLNDLDTDKRFRLARAAKRQSDAELKLIRLVAEQEGATKTVEMVDKMIEMRSVKLDAALDEAKNARREEMIKEREERRKMLEERRKSRRDQ